VDPAPAGPFWWACCASARVSDGPARRRLPRPKASICRPLEQAEVAPHHVMLPQAQESGRDTLPHMYTSGSCEYLLTVTAGFTPHQPGRSSSVGGGEAILGDLPGMVAVDVKPADPCASPLSRSAFNAWTKTSARLISLLGCTLLRSDPQLLTASKGAMGRTRGLRRGGHSHVRNLRVLRSSRRHRTPQTGTTVAARLGRLRHAG
jgi:hypothetical protein